MGEKIPKDWEAQAYRKDFVFDSSEAAAKFCLGVSDRFKNIIYGRDVSCSSWKVWQKKYHVHVSGVRTIQECLIVESVYKDFNLQSY